MQLSASLLVVGALCFFSCEHLKVANAYAQSFIAMLLV